MATVNVFFQKDKKGDQGYVYVNFKEKGAKPKRVSTKIKLTDKQYYDHKNKQLPTFNPNLDFDYKTLNEEIVKIIYEYNVPAKSESETDFISYFRTWLDSQNHGGTKKTFTSIYNRLQKDFPNGLKFTEMDNSFFESYSKKLIKIPNLTNGYVRFCIQLILQICNVSNLDSKIKTPSIVYDLRKLNISKNPKRKSNLLCDDDVNKLLYYSYNRTNPDKANTRNFEYITFGLTQMFGSGCRFSDLILIKHSNFKDDGIQIQIPKTNEYKKIGYSVMLLKTLYRYIYRDDFFTETELSNILNFQFNTHEKVLLMLKTEVLRWIRNQQQDDFFFSFAPRELKNYDILKPFTDEQFRLFSNCRSLYNKHLHKIGKDLDFSHPLSSHAFRYKFVSNCVNQKVSIYDISKMLGHSSVLTTEKYIKDHFDYIDSVEILNVVDQKYFQKQE